MLSIHKKVTLAAGAIILLMLLIVTTAKPIVYIGGLIFLEILNPRNVFFRGPPDTIWENGFELTTELPCNKLYERNVHVIFEPDLSFAASMNSLQGDIIFMQNEGTDTYEMPITPLNKRRTLFDNRIAGIVAVGFPEYPVLGGFKCKEQQVYLKFDDLNFDPRNYEITIIIQRIGIDG